MDEKKILRYFTIHLEGFRCGLCHRLFPSWDSEDLNKHIRDSHNDVNVPLQSTLCIEEQVNQMLTEQEEYESFESDSENDSLRPEDDHAAAEERLVIEMNPNVDIKPVKLLPIGPPCIMFSTFLTKFVDGILNIGEFQSALDALRKFIDVLHSKQETYYRHGRTDLSENLNLPSFNDVKWTSILAFLTDCLNMARYSKLVSSKIIDFQHQTFADFANRFELSYIGEEIHRQLTYLHKLMSQISGFENEIYKPDSLTSEVVPQAISIREFMKKETSEFEVEEKMKKVFDENFNCLLNVFIGNRYVFATFLDPRYGYQENLYPTDKWIEIEDSFVEIFKYYESTKNQNCPGETSLETRVKEELQWYRLEVTAARPDKEVHISHWWSGKVGKLENLYRQSSDLLTPLAITVEDDQNHLFNPIGDKCSICGVMMEEGEFENNLDSNEKLVVFLELVVKKELSSDEARNKFMGEARMCYGYFPESKAKLFEELSNLGIASADKWMKCPPEVLKPFLDIINIIQGEDMTFFEFKTFLQSLFSESARNITPEPATLDEVLPQETDPPAILLKLPATSKNARKNLHKRKLPKDEDNSKKNKMTKKDKYFGKCSYCERSSIGRSLLIRVPVCAKRRAVWFKKYGKKFETRVSTLIEPKICRANFPKTAFSEAGKLNKKAIPLPINKRNH